MYHSTQAHTQHTRSDPRPPGLPNLGLGSPCLPCSSSSPLRPPKSPRRYLTYDSSQSLVCSIQVAHLQSPKMSPEQSSTPADFQTPADCRRDPIRIESVPPASDEGPQRTHRRTSSCPSISSTQQTAAGTVPRVAKVDAVSPNSKGSSIALANHSLHPSEGVDHLPVPLVRLTRPSKPPPAEPQPFARVVDLMTAGQISPFHERTPEPIGHSTPKRKRSGPAALIGKCQKRQRAYADRIASSSSLRRITSSLYRLAPNSPSFPRADPRYANGIETAVEIPRFKMRELQLGIVRTSYHRLLWVIVWALRLVTASLLLFFDINTFYLLLQCTIYPSHGSNAKASWAFATSAYAICWMASILVALGWGLGFEYWRKWRLPRPAIEPIHFSLYASLNLGLFSIAHFAFLVHIRTSPWRTPFQRDIIPETCHALLQLFPALLAVVPRVAMAIVLLVAYSSPATKVSLPFGAQDLSLDRDRSFFQVDGSLTAYARGALLAFTAYVAVRVLIIATAALILWIFSSKKLDAKPVRRVAKSSIPQLDPSQTASPRRHWLSQETEVDWAWRERSVARIQDAFELCLVRKGSNLSTSRFGTPIPLSPLSFPIATGVKTESPSEPPADPVSPSPAAVRQPRLAPSTSSQDIFYTPTSSTPVFNVPSSRANAPPSAFRPPRADEDAANTERPADNDAMRPPVAASRERAASEASTKSTSPAPSQSSGTRKRSSTSGSLRIIRSFSASRLRQAADNGAAIVRRARSGTLVSAKSGYSRIEAEEE